MKFNPADKQKLSKGFAAIKWCISKSEIQVNHDDWKGYRFAGNLPWYSVQAIEAMIDAGYRDTNGGFSLSWIADNAEHHVTASFGSFKSNQNRIELFYNVYSIDANAA